MAFGTADWSVLCFGWLEPNFGLELRPTNTADGRDLNSEKVSWYNDKLFLNKEVLIIDLCRYLQ